MQFNHLAVRRLALAATCAATVSLAPATAHAGFFDQLFGMAPQQAPVQQSTPDQGYGFDQQRLGETPLPTRHKAKKVVAAVDRTPKLQKTTDLMSDKTLRPGDAVMMKSGVHIFVGDRDSHHDADDFVALGESHKSAKRDGELVAMDVAHRAPLDYVGGETTMLEGRSVGGRPLSEGYKITDARGNSVRYVGP